MNAISVRFSGSNKDCVAEAFRMANYANQYLYHISRGAVPSVVPGATVIFGTDGYGGSVWARDEVLALRNELGRRGITELGFGVDSGGEEYSWAMLVACADAKMLSDLVWDCWQGAEPDADAPG